MRKACLLCFLFCAFLAAPAKDTPLQVLTWPESGTPTLRFTFGKFKEVGEFRQQRTYTCETTAENLSGKLIPNANFLLYLYDKNKARIGEGDISLSNVGPGETVKFQTNIDASGVPVSISLEVAAAKTISITVNSVPQGATVKMDGTDIGTTPKLAQVGVGKHILEFSKEGFNTGKFPLEIGPTDTSGGSVSYELGAAAQDTVELRDGSILTGDLESVSATEVVLRTGGSMQHLNRNLVKRILLVERDTPQPRQ